MQTIPQAYAMTVSLLGASLLFGCGDAFDAGGTGGAGGSISSTATTTGTAGAGGTKAAFPAGCADGSREAYVDVDGEPRIAGCDGIFSVPGIIGTIEPECDRAAGNDGAQADGQGCTIEDLCAPGWHVCRNAGDVALEAASGACPVTTGTDPQFWLTRQGQTPTAECSATGTNNVVGCGRDAGQPPRPDAGCAPLDAELTKAACDALAAWSCGELATEEGSHVTKIALGEGGVLCCRDE